MDSDVHDKISYRICQISRALKTRIQLPLDVAQNDTLFALKDTPNAASITTTWDVGKHETQKHVETFLCAMVRGREEQRRSFPDCL